MALYYLETSAAFKLLAAEEHAEAFLAFYREHRTDSWISSDLLRIEVTTGDISGVDVQASTVVSGASCAIEPSGTVHDPPIHDPGARVPAAAPAGRRPPGGGPPGGGLCPPWRSRSNR